MQQSVFQPTNQPTTKQQQREHLRKHLTVNGVTPDEATLTRVLSAKPKPAPKGDVPSCAFSLLR